MAVEPDSAGVRFPPPFVYLGALLLGLAAERFVTLRSFGIDWRLLVATGVPRDDLVIVADQHWIGEAEAPDALGDLGDLLLRMGASVPGIGAQRSNRPHLDGRRRNVHSSAPNESISMYRNKA
jgi:hypothetical protein